MHQRDPTDPASTPWRRVAAAVVVSQLASRLCRRSRARAHQRLLPRAPTPAAARPNACCRTPRAARLPSVCLPAARPTCPVARPAQRPTLVPSAPAACPCRAPNAPCAHACCAQRAQLPSPCCIATQAYPRLTILFVLQYKPAAH